MLNIMFIAIIENIFKDTFDFKKITRPNIAKNSITLILSMFKYKRPPRAVTNYSNLICFIC